ncbi:MAG: hypothetical protein HPY62_00885 [Bacteroidales bacterium]|nr:hypothetical protein [Bacteroidales bacterium]
MADHNNSNLTPDAAPAATGEWELLHGIVPITVFITCHLTVIANPQLAFLLYSLSLSTIVTRLDYGLQ